MTKIFCPFSLFDLHQKVYLVDNSVTREICISTMDNLEEDIVKMCVKYDVNRVLLKGNKEYGSAMAEGIHRTGIVYYNTNDIEVEVE